jgi:integrase
VRLGPAHVRDAGRRTARGAIVWRAGDGPRPTPEHLTPQDAEARLEQLLREYEARAEEAARKETERVLHEAAEGWLAGRHAERGLKRSTVADYEDMFERLYRDLGADTPLHELADGRLALYFADFKAERPLGKLSASKAPGEGRDVVEVEVDRLLSRAPGVVEEAFWLCGAHAGFRLPGEALGLRWGAVDFSAGVIRPYDNWVRNALDGTKTSDSAAIPMTPRLTRTLAVLKERGYATGDGDYVFVNALREKPIAEQPIREAFTLAREQAGLKPIRMYNLRHSFGTALARAGVDIRTIQALMRHERITTTEQYLAYAPQPDLAERLTRALDLSASASGS